MQHNAQHRLPVPCAWLVMLGTGSNTQQAYAAGDGGAAALAGGLPRGPNALLATLCRAVACHIVPHRNVLCCLCRVVPQKPKVKSTPWGSTYREAPEILHGYTSKVGGAVGLRRGRWYGGMMRTGCGIALRCARLSLSTCQQRAQLVALG